MPGLCCENRTNADPQQKYFGLNEPVQIEEIPTLSWQAYTEGRAGYRPKQEADMKHLTLSPIACGAFLVVSAPAGAEVPGNAIMLTPEQMKW